MTNPRVLVVDDSAVVRQIVRSVLTRNGYDLMEAADGEEGLRMDLVERPDLLILDVMLPNRSGFEICSELKRCPRTRSMPILILTGITAGTGDSDEYWRVPSLADDFMSKPFSARELLERVGRLVRAGAVAGARVA